MANLKLHTIGIHGGFHHNFLYTVVRTVCRISRGDRPSSPLHSPFDHSGLTIAIFTHHSDLGQGAFIFHVN